VEKATTADRVPTWTNYDKSIVRIKNTDDLCIARAIVVAKARPEHIATPGNNSETCTNTCARVTQKTERSNQGSQSHHGSCRPSKPQRGLWHPRDASDTGHFPGLPDPHFHFIIKYNFATF